MIYKWSWGIALVAFGLIEIGTNFPYLILIGGIALIVAGIAFIAGL